MKGAVFVDANVFLRLLLNDHSEQSVAARLLFGQVEEGRLTIWTSHLVIAELVWMLSSPTYRFSRDEIASGIRRLLSYTHLKVPRKQLFRRVLSLYTTHAIDYIDAYHAALLQSAGDPRLYSFDRDFDKVVGLTRLEPRGA
jgi:predicted nucleic acid-binding protein